LFQYRQVFGVEVRFPDTPPVMIIGDHVKARGERSVGPDEGAVHTGTAIPLAHIATHSPFERLKVFDGVYHGPAPALFVDQPVKETIHLIVLIRRHEQPVILVLVVIPVRKTMRWLVEVIVRPDVVLVGYLGEKPHILYVGPTDVSRSMPGFALSH
jgi:hypothetical protein